MNKGYLDKMAFDVFQILQTSFKKSPILLTKIYVLTFFNSYLTYCIPIRAFVCN